MLFSLLAIVVVWYVLYKYSICSLFSSLHWTLSICFQLLFTLSLSQLHHESLVHETSVEWQEQVLIY